MAGSSLNIQQIILRIIAIIAFVEFFIMLGFGVLEFETNIYLMAVIDIVILVSLSAPLIYYLVVSPFVKARDDVLAQLELQAITDPLTNLANRRSIDIELGKSIASSIRHNVYGALMLMDLDGFKQINDTYGHDAGDFVIIEIANRLKSRVRVDEVVGRFGGDEFTLSINNLGADRNLAVKAAMQTGEQLVTLISQPINYKDEVFTIGMSVGIRLFGFEVIDAELLVKDADMAMYQAKQAGKGRCFLIDGGDIED